MSSRVQEKPKSGLKPNVVVASQKTRSGEPTLRLKPIQSVSSRSKGPIIHLKPSSLVAPENNGKATQALKPSTPVPSSSADEKPSVSMKPTSPLAPLCAELQALQRQRAVYIKSRIMVSNRLQALVAGTMGYHSGMAEKERMKSFSEASKLIKQIEKGEVVSPLGGLVMVHLTGIREFERVQAEIEKAMVKMASQLSVAPWVQAKEQRGFGILSLAIVIGETGNLSNYTNPGKVWRRLGCAPWSFDGKTLMGASWRSGKDGKLPASEWESFGYSPRRRSIAYLIGEGLIKQNFVVGNGVGDGETGVLHVVKPDHKKARKAVGAGVRRDETEPPIAGPYRLRYDQTKVLFQQKHPEYKPLRCHLHGMLLATKLLLKNLWIEWNK